jgi:zona occludens toxin (predicted ATPase)
MLSQVLRNINDTKMIEITYNTTNNAIIKYNETWNIYDYSNIRSDKKDIKKNLRGVKKSLLELYEEEMSNFF